MASSREAPTDDDLYGDLSDTKPAAVSKVATATVAAPSLKSTPTYASIPNESIQALQKQINDLTEENSILKRNIGTLYRTAKAEVKRKDDEIARLLYEIEELKKK